MIKFKKLPILILASVLLSCSFPTKNAKRAVTLSLKSDALEIHNETSNKIYVFVVESDHAALINWAPLFSQPSINKGQSMEIKFTDIDNGKSDPVKKDDRIIVYWWTDKYTTDKNVYSESIVL